MLREGMGTKGKSNGKEWKEKKENSTKTIKQQI
jgi:hypothetical protein